MAKIHPAYLSSKEPRQQTSKYRDLSFQIEDVIPVAAQKIRDRWIATSDYQKAKINRLIRSVPSSKIEIDEYSESAAKFFSFKPMQKTASVSFSGGFSTTHECSDLAGFFIFTQSLRNKFPYLRRQLKLLACLEWQEDNRNCLTTAFVRFSS